MERKYGNRTQDFRSNGSQHAELLARFRKQMADYARAETFKRLRDERHLSQEEAAHELGVSVKTVRSWEKGGGIKWQNAKRVAQFYGVAPEALVGRELPEVEEGASEQLDRIERMLRALLPKEALAELDALEERLGEDQRDDQQGASSGSQG